MKKKNKFDYDDDREKAERIPQAPPQNPQAKGIADFLSKISGREKTGYATNWHPAWAKKVKPFTYYFFEDKLVIDLFGELIDAKEAGAKRQLCGKHGIAYIFKDEDQELSGAEVAAMLGKTGIKWESREEGK